MLNHYAMVSFDLHMLKHTFGPAGPWNVPGVHEDQHIGQWMFFELQMLRNAYV